jgi:translation initiation factor IF-3
MANPPFQRPNQFQNNRSQGNFQNQPQINEAIRSPNVRLISSSGEQLGIVPTREALDQAKAEGLDLVVIGMQQPPVAKIIDYGKYKFEKEKEDKERKKKSKAQSVFKELKLSARIDEHDLKIKEKWICKWLEEGSKVRVVVQMKGREMQHPELARKVLQSVLVATNEFGKSDQVPAIRQEGRTFNIQLAPHLPKK